MSSSKSDVPSKQLLLGAELVQQRKRAGKSLPVKKNKGFRPSGSWLEQRQIQSSSDEISGLLEEQRIEKQGSLAKAEWNPQFRKAEVTCRVGAQWNTVGHEKRGKLLLFPEEALFLMEVNKLQVYFDGMPMSIQQAYTVLLGSYNGCTVDEYRTYAHLVKQGYILLRHSKELHVTRYEQKIRLHQHTLNQKHSKGKPKSFTNVLVTDKGLTSSNRMHKNSEDVDIIEDISTNTQSNDKGITSSNQMHKNTEDVDIIEDISTNTQSNDKGITSSNQMHKSTEDVDIIEDISTNTQSNDKGITSNNRTHKNTEDVDIIEDISTNTQGNGKGITNSNRMHKSTEEVDIIEDISTNTQSSDKGITSSNQMHKNTEEVDIIEDLSANTQSNDKVITSSNVMGKNTEEVDIIEDISTNTQSNDHRESNVGAVQRLKKTGNLELGDSNTSAERKQMLESIREENVSDRPLDTEMQSRLLTSENDYESIEVEKSDYSKPSSNNTWPHSTSVDVPEKEQNFCRESSQNMTEAMPVKEEKNNLVNKERTDHVSSVKTVAAAVHSHTNLSDIIILDEDVPSVTNRNRQLSDSSSSECGSVKCETPYFKASRKRKFVDEVKATADRKPVVSDLDSECEVLEISTSKKEKLKESTSENIMQRLINPTQDMKSGIKLDVAKVQSNGLDWNQPSSSNVEVNNIGKHRITNVQLSDTEIEIVPGVIDKAKEDNLQKQESSNDIEVIDLDDDNGRYVKTSLLKKEEKMRILDSLPSVESKFLIHVKAPSQDLLPPNVTPQKEDYYIQLRRLNAAGIGGRPRTAENGEQNNTQVGDIESQSEPRINPWLARPPEQTEQYTLGTNVHQGANFLINQNFSVSPYNMLQAVWQQQLVSLVPFMNNPMWNVNLFGMQLPWLQPQMNMWHPPRQNRGRPSWRRPYRGRGRGRFRHQSTQVSRYPVKDHASSRNAEGNESSGTIPVQLEDNRTVERNDHPESKLSVSKMKSQSLIDLEETAELVILDDDDDNNSDEPIAVSSPESSSIRQRERNKQKWKKRGASVPNRYFKPPKRIQGLMERPLSETNAEQLLKQGDEDVMNAEVDKVAERISLNLGNKENWRDFKDTMSHAMQEVILDSTSSEEETEEEIDVTSDPEPCENELCSLVQPEDCISIDNVLSKLQIIRPINMQEDHFCASEKIPKISFDVYLPNTSFRKANPGLPQYRIAVVGFQEHIPPFEELAKMMKPFQDDVPIVFAVVTPDSVTFVQVGSVNLPVEVKFRDVM